MNWLSVVLQVVIALGLLNVWLVRARGATSYRGGEAQSLRAEFAAYGLPEWMFYLVGALKVGAAVALLLGIWLEALVVPAVALVAVLMVGAIAMHVKVKDPLMKALPAALMLLLSVGILLLR